MDTSSFVLGYKNAKAIEDVEYRVNDIASTVTGKTWVFYDNLESANSLECEFNFISNGQEFNGIVGELRYGSNDFKGYQLFYRLAHNGNWISVYDGLTGDYWLDAEYQTIYTDDTSVSLRGWAVEKDTTAAERLETKSKSVFGAINETFNKVNDIASSVNDIASTVTGKTWVFYDDLEPANSFEREFNFISNGRECNGIRGKLRREVIDPDAGISWEWYQLSYRYAENGNWFIVYNGFNGERWSDAEYQTIYTDDTSVSLQGWAVEKDTTAAERLETKSKSVFGAINELNAKIVYGYYNQDTGEWFEDKEFTRPLNINIYASGIYIDMLAKNVRFGVIDIDLISLIWELIKRANAGEQ